MDFELFSPESMADVHLTSGDVLRDHRMLHFAFNHTRSWHIVACRGSARLGCLLSGFNDLNLCGYLAGFSGSIRISY